MSEGPEQVGPEPIESSMPQEYLGDGVYARWDGWSVILDLRGQGEDWSEIALDPDVRKKLDRFVKRCQADDEMKAGAAL